ncbi:MAG: SH3 domain-containing protein [Candidatus Cloacimonetes bacterium]|nr:SH3 domain-containing protein [Candidatus Cloacimonadota bacterium]
MMKQTGLLVLFAFWFCCLSGMENRGKLDALYRKLGIPARMQTPDFWIASLSAPDAVIMDKETIARFNEQNITKSASMADIFQLPPTLDAEELSRRIQNISQVPTSLRFYAPKKSITPQQYQQLMQNTDLENLPETTTVRYGLVTRRSYFRTFPSELAALRKGGKFDYFLETAIYFCEPLALLHLSKDGKWYFAQSYNYQGWVPVAHVAVGSKAAVEKYASSPRYRIVTTSRYYLTIDDALIQADMGTKIPCDTSDKFTEYLMVPLRSNTGELTIRRLSVPKTPDLARDYLPYTRGNIIRQGFRFAGEIYGWGGMHNTRDCSGFIMDIYRSMGVLLPRNAAQQAYCASGVFYPMASSLNAAERVTLLSALPGPMPVYLDGHTMLYLGMVNGTPYILHDFVSFKLTPKSATTNAEITAVTPLTILRNTGKSYLLELYGARDFRY